jgi:tRNA threonylcarbamoyladenosine biosynthesis protein TsaE
MTPAARTPGPRTPLAATLTVPGAAATRAVAAEVARHLVPGDLILLTGALGAGKTTFTQGLGEELGVRGPVASPTFVISRVHPSLRGGPALVHVDAYRLGGELDVDDLDLDADLDTAVTVVEWGGGKAEHLADSRLEITLDRGATDAALGAGTSLDPADAGGDEPRTLLLRPHGPGWGGTRFAALLESLAAVPDTTLEA